uniref:Checkpoint protein n=1 Tax=Microcebus murinus TaxID=30608 RepID=A0A8C5YBG1_MICMU
AKITSKGFLQLAEVCAPRCARSAVQAAVLGATGSGGQARQGAFCQFPVEGLSKELSEICLKPTWEHGDAPPWSSNFRGWPPCAGISLVTLVAVHDLSGGVLPKRLWQDCPEPSVRASDVSVYLPALKTLKSIVERTANLGDHVLVETNLSGQMNFSLEADVVRIKSYFKNLGNPPKSALGMPQNQNWENMVQVWVDNRKLLQFFQGQQINPTTALCNIFSKTLLHLVLVHEALSLQYFIPAS